MLIGADVARPPASSYATALTRYAPLGSALVSQRLLGGAQLVALHDSVANTFPAPHSSIRVSFLVLDACAPTLIPDPVHTPLVGVVIETVGGAVDGPAFA